MIYCNYEIASKNIVVVKEVVIIEYEQIKLKDILDFDGLKEELKKQYPDCRIKLRFNTSWTDKDGNGKELYRNYLDMYTSDDKDTINFFYDSILSIYGGKRVRLVEQDIVFQFIEIKEHIWLLVDVVVITKQCREKKGYNDFTKCEYDVAEAVRLEKYNPYFSRLTVEWKNAPQNFFYVKEDIINSICVNEILPRDYREIDEEFCGYENVSKSYKALKNVIDKPKWKEALSNVYGVYVLTDKKTGKLYIGSATGDEGIYSRWKTYLDSGYDKENKDYPNKKLKELVQKGTIKYIQENFIYSILEIFPKNDIGKGKALERESYWKKVFHSREVGYNDN